jgi:hypothetical protein
MSIEHDVERELSVEQMVRNILERAEKDGLIRCSEPPQGMSSGDLIACANLLDGYFRDDAI